MEKKVIIASESAFRRNLLSEMLSSHQDITIVDNVRNQKEAISSIRNNSPELLILDIEFKNRAWYEQFYPILKQFPITAIVLTDIDPRTKDLLEVPIILKQYEYIIKPDGIWKDELPKIKEKIISTIIKVEAQKIHRVNSQARLNKRNAFIRQSQESRAKKMGKTSQIRESKIVSPVTALIEPRLEEYFLEIPKPTYVKLDSKIVVIGASVGGPRTLRLILSEIPKNFPASILVVQHLNHLFMRQFVVSLRNVCNLNVRIGANYEEIQPGIIYFSPGDKHMQVTVKNNNPCIRTFEGEPINFCRPSVDVLFYSTARVFKNKALGILLTGMGRDGVAGLLAIKSEGGKTIAESEETSILYGMPKAAAETGAADLILPNYRIVEQIINFVN